MSIKNIWGPVLERNYWLCQCKSGNHVDPFAVASSSSEEDGQG